MDVWPVIRRTKAAEIREGRADRKILTGVDSGKNNVAMRGRARWGGVTFRFEPWRVPTGNENTWKIYVGVGVDIAKNMNNRE